MVSEEQEGTVCVNANPCARPSYSTDRSTDDLLSLKSDMLSLLEEMSGKPALHWAEKQGCMEAADMMARSGADVNQRVFEQVQMDY